MKKISVIVGMYNCENTLTEAIESIIKQSYSNWELILCDDGSLDKSYEIAEIYEKKYPEKIILLKNDKNMGLNFTLNKCLEVTRGEYIARMDADDISLENRFEKQIEVLEKNKEFSIVSSNMIYFDEKSEWGKSNVKEKPQKNDFIYGTPFCHAPAMVRKEAYLKVNGYTEKESLLRVEDYHLWMKMYYEGLRGINIKEPLYKMRDDRNAYARRKFKYRINEVYVKYLAFKLLNLDKKKFFYILKPLVIGFIPNNLYNYVHKKAWKSRLNI